jgi:hypothetical protein
LDAVFLIELNIVGRDGQVSPVRHGVPGIDAKL